jgi:predicted acylesterase/phospholipase RssA
LLTRLYNDAGGVFHRKLTVASANVNTGAYTLFDEKDPEIIKGILSSASIPFIFPHQHWEDRDLVMMDGGTIWNLNLVSAVQRCQNEIGAENESDITIDLIICGNNKLNGWEDRDNGYENYMRWKSINDYHSGLDDIFEFKQAFPDVNFRYFV